MRIRALLASTQRVQNERLRRFADQIGFADTGEIFDQRGDYRLPSACRRPRSRRYRDNRPAPAPWRLHVVALESLMKICDAARYDPHSSAKSCARPEAAGDGRNNRHRIVSFHQKKSWRRHGGERDVDRYQAVRASGRRTPARLSACHAQLRWRAGLCASPQRAVPPRKSRGPISSPRKPASPSRPHRLDNNSIEDRGAIHIVHAHDHLPVLGFLAQQPPL